MGPNDIGRKTKKNPVNTGVSGLYWMGSDGEMVEPDGIEPTTSCMPCKRSPN